MITEHGIAELRGRTTRERAEALAAIAHPDFRSDAPDRGGRPAVAPTGAVSRDAGEPVRRPVRFAWAVDQQGGPDHEDRGDGTVEPVMVRGHGDGEDREDRVGDDQVPES